MPTGYAESVDNINDAVSMKMLITFFSSLQ